MTKFILGIFMGAGLSITWLALWEKEERKKQREYEKWRARL